MKQNHKINLKVSGNFNSIFVRTKLTKKEQIEKINKKLSKLDQQILVYQTEFNQLQYNKLKLIEELKNG